LRYLILFKSGSNTTRICRFSCGFSCEKYSAGIPEDFAEDYASYTKFPANPDTAGISAGNFYFAEDFSAVLVTNLISTFP